MDHITPAKTDKIVGKGAFADEEDFSQWVIQTRRQLVRFCRQMTGSWDEAEDIAQEAYQRAWEKRKSFRGNCSLLTWQMAIAKRLCLDKLRGVRLNCFVPLNELDATPQAELDTALDVRAALDKLGAEDRTILYLRVFEELPFEEIGRIWGKSAAACRKRYERAKKRFKDAYGKRE